MIIISLSGTHSVGKTTLLNDLFYWLKNYFNVKVIPEAARILINRRFKMNADITEYGIINYTKYYLNQLRIQNADFILSDRSTLDLYAYITVNNSPKVRNDIMELIEEIIYLEKTRISYYFYIPIEFPMEYDMIRPIDVGYRNTVDSVLKELFDLFSIKYIILNGTKEERLNKVLEIINNENKSLFRFIETKRPRIANSGDNKNQ